MSFLLFYIQANCCLLACQLNGLGMTVCTALFYDISLPVLLPMCPLTARQGPNSPLGLRLIIQSTTL